MQGPSLKKVELKTIREWETGDLMVRSLWTLAMDDLRAELRMLLIGYYILGICRSNIIWCLYCLVYYSKQYNIIPEQTWGEFGGGGCGVMMRLERREGREVLIVCGVNGVFAN